MRKPNLILTGFMLSIGYMFLFVPTSLATIEAESRAPITINKDDRYKRIEAIEEQVKNLQIRHGHPRILITSEMLPDLKARAGQKAYQNIIKNADAFDPATANETVLYNIEKNEEKMIAASVAYLLTDNPRYADKVYWYISAKLYKKWSEYPEKSVLLHQLSRACLAFDQAYNGFTQQQKDELIAKLSDLNEIALRQQNGVKKNGETFHREEWIYFSHMAWSEIALAHHVPGAQEVYKSRWSWDTYWGDALRMYAWAGDGTPFEGYYYGADGAGWFIPLKNATGINVVDTWCKGAAEHLLYRLDFDRQREIFHMGVGHRSVFSWYDQTNKDLWKLRDQIANSFMLIADNPFAKWVMDNQTGYGSAWNITIDYVATGMAGLSDLNKLIYYDERIAAKDPRQGLKPTKFFPTGREVVTGSGVKGIDTRVYFRAGPAFTKTSHSDFDAASFGLYKNSQALSVNAGTYDAYTGQTNYMAYQKLTVAHNTILFIDPADIDAPYWGLRGNFGGTNIVSPRSFQGPTGSIFVQHTNPAEWTEILKYEEKPEYVYLAVDASKAYGSARVSKFSRHFMFVPDGDNGFVVVYDDIDFKDGLIAKALFHAVTKPEAQNETITNTEVAGHIETLANDTFVSKNQAGDAKVTCKVLLPGNAVVRRVGGAGYEYWVDGKSPRNVPLDPGTFANIPAFSGGPSEEIGQWRLETIGDGGNFFHVFYVSDADEPVPSMQYKNIDGKDAVVIGDKTVLFDGGFLRMESTLNPVPPIDEPLAAIEPPQPSPEPAPAPLTPPEPFVTPPSQPNPQPCQACQVCAPFESPTVYTASQMGSIKAEMYGKMDAGEVVKFYHSTRKKLYQCRQGE